MEIRFKLNNEFIPGVGGTGVGGTGVGGTGVGGTESVIERKCDQVEIGIPKVINKN